MLVLAISYCPLNKITSLMEWFTNIYTIFFKDTKHPGRKQLLLLLQLSPQQERSPPLPLLWTCWFGLWRIRILISRRFCFVRYCQCYQQQQSVYFRTRRLSIPVINTRFQWHNHMYALNRIDSINSIQ